ncbi:hypothetical protein [Flavobacterium sp.]|uniref:hypothetical protein n=1 Tax=Flavobacterium sp. TaxID=239 RepID=UPI0040344CB4
MTYNYNTPQNAILSLESAYNNRDMEAIINSKDFIAEAKIILDKVSLGFEPNDEELISETAELLKLSLIRSIQENGFPNFEGVEVEFSEISKADGDLFYLNEKVTYPDGTFYYNKIFLTFDGSEWKIATIEE